jgi:hypothetical protein
MPAMSGLQQTPGRRLSISISVIFRVERTLARSLQKSLRKARLSASREAMRG